MPDLSVVIPAFNEAHRLSPTLERILPFLRAEESSFEILVVDDGSSDDTAGVARSFDAPEVKVVRHMVNRGKGAALRTGVLASQGERVLLCDADLSVPIEELDRLSPHLAAADLVMGSRAAPGARVTRRQALYRSLMGKTFNRIIRTLGVRGFRDTQCGFKLLTGDVARELFSRLMIERFAYDVELVWLALRQGHRVVEVGVTWGHVEFSRVNPVSDSLNMLWDVIRFRFHHYRSGTG